MTDSKPSSHSSIHTIVLIIITALVFVIGQDIKAELEQLNGQIKTLNKHQTNILAWLEESDTQATTETGEPDPDNTE